MATIVASISDLTNGKSFGTFKFQYSKYSPVHPEPGIVPKNKIDAENFIGMVFCQFLTMHLKSKISSFKLNENDGNKNPDVIIIENGIKKGVQISQLQFTDYEARKAIAKQKNLELAIEIGKVVKINFPLVVNIFPTSRKDTIPLITLKRGKSKKEALLVTFISSSIKANIENLISDTNPIWIAIKDIQLSSHFSKIVLNAIPKDSFSRFPGKDNIFVNYDFNDVAYNLVDIDLSIEKMYFKKNSGNSDILLLWLDDFGIHNNKRYVVTKLYEKFIDSTFKEIYLLTFTNNVALFKDSLQLWPIKRVILKSRNPHWALFWG